jgi:beta-ureidopropionase / N-carbamoyl-L-amino-acid hydrolase
MGSSEYRETERRKRPVINRLKEDLVRISAMGRPSNRVVKDYGQLDPNRGVTRPEGSIANKVLRDFTVEQMQAAGLLVRVDAVGNIFGRKEGADSGAKTLMIGSHLDSVVNGGHLDGALGVFSGIEALRRLRDENFHHQRPIEVTAFTGEEGSAFAVGDMLGSAVISGKMDTQAALSIRNVSGQTLDEVLVEMGYKGGFEYCVDDVDTFLELHIEQGPVLDNENISVGIVEQITGITWLRSLITGFGNHAGTTPMHLRQDALVAAADGVTFMNRRAREMATSCQSPIVGTTGHLKVYPNNMNVIPARVELGFDIRAARLEDMQQLTHETISFLHGLRRENSIDVHVEAPDIQAPVQLSAEIVKIIEQSAVQAGIGARKMASGAGHDALNMASIARTGMIFVPSVRGISHSPMEWTEWDDIEKGVSVLTGAIKMLSAKIS